ncbi:MAG: hypothetical protein ACYC48_01540 [Minisyncoccota bacterium]
MSAAKGRHSSLSAPTFSGSSGIVMLGYLETMAEYRSSGFFNEIVTILSLKIRFERESEAKMPRFSSSEPFSNHVRAAAA